MVYTARYRATMDMISKVGSVLSNLEVSQKWGEARTRWQEGMEGPVVATGAVRICFSCSGWMSAIDLWKL